MAPAVVHCSGPDLVGARSVCGAEEDGVALSWADSETINIGNRFCGLNYV